jgi:hypothetical protein
MYEHHLWREDGFVPYEYSCPFVKRTFHTCTHVIGNFFLYTIHKASVSTGFTEQIMPILRILCYNGSLVTWTVVGLTTAKFKLCRSTDTASARINRKHIENTYPSNPYIVVEACLRRRCVETEILLLSAYSFRQECVPLPSSGNTCYNIHKFCSYLTRTHYVDATEMSRLLVF